MAFDHTADPASPEMAGGARVPTRPLLPCIPANTASDWAVSSLALHPLPARGSSACLRYSEVRTIPTLVTLSLPLRLTAWLSLALVFLTGLIPGQGVVVCIEDDGCVSIEMKAVDASCDGCEGHEESGPLAQGAPASSEDVPCPCIDLAIPGSPEQQLAKASSVDVHVGPWVAPPPEIPVQHATPTATAGRGPPPCIPRVAGSWEHIRTVVLLV